MKAPDPRTVAGGGVLVLASAGLLAFLGDWEDGPTRKNTEAARVVYADALAGGLPTTCGGITKHVSPYPVIVGDMWSQARCDEVLGMVAKKGQLKLLDCVTAPDLTQNVFDALTSHAHNFGTGATCASRAVGLINAGQPEAGCRALAHAEDGKTPVWSYVSLPDGRKVFVKGLYNRRLAEEALCLKK